MTRLGMLGRKVSRLERRMPVHFKVNGESCKGYILNFSEIGLFVATETLLDPESIETFACRITEKEYINVTGRVMWVRRPDQVRNPNEPAGFGVEITDPPLNYRNFVKKYREFLQTKNRQEDLRFEATHRVSFASGPAFLSEYTENLSRGGMYLATDEELEAGKVISIRLEIPGIEQPLDLEGRVAYKLNADQAKEIGRSAGVGLQFIDLSQHSTVFLHHYLRRLEIHRQSRDHRRTENIPNKGSLSEFLVAEILLNLFERKLTGMLSLKNGSTHKTVYLKKGQPVYVDSTLRIETLGYHLWRNGIISEEDYSISLEEFANHDFHHGEVMVRGGLIDAQTLAKALVVHQEEKLSNTFPWFHGEFEFTESKEWPEHISIFPLRSYEIVFNGVERWYDTAVIKAWMNLTEDCLLRQIELPDQTANIPVHVLKLIKSLKKPRQLKHVATEMHLLVEELLPVCFAAILCGWINFSEAPPQMKEEAPETTDSDDNETQASMSSDEVETIFSVREDYRRISFLNFFQVLDLEPGSSDATLKMQYLKLRERYSEEKINEIKNDEVRKMASEIMNWIQLAYDTLSDPQLRQIYSRRGQKKTAKKVNREHLAADRILLASIRKLEQGDIKKTLELLDTAHKTYPDDYTISGYYGYALFLSHPKPNLKIAIEYLEKSTEREAADAQLRFFQGEVFAYLGDTERAEHAYEKALRLQPNFMRAELALDKVKTKRINMKRIANKRK